MRPVFMIVMGIFLIVIAWRICYRTKGWTSRLIISGALLLGFGYAVVLPLYESKSIERISPAGRYQHNGANAIGWHCVKLVAMNSGWLLLGLGLAMHSKAFSTAPRRRKPTPLPLTSHESVA